VDEIGIRERERTGGTCRAALSPLVSHAGRRVDVVTLRDVLQSAARSKARKDILAMLGRPIGWTAVEHWLSGRRPMPDWAIAVVRDRLAGLEAALLARRGKDRGTVGRRSLGAYWAARRAARDAGKVEP